MLDEYARAGKVANLRPQARASADRLRHREIAAKKAPQPFAADRRATRKDSDGDVLPRGAVARLGTTRYRHSARSLAVPSVVAFLDEKILVVTGPAEPVRFVNLSNGIFMQWADFPMPTAGYVRGAETGFVLSRDGKTLASQLGLWDVPGRKRMLVQQSRGPLGEARDRPMAFSPDGNTLVEQRAIGTEAGKLYLWSLDSGERRPLEGTEADWSIVGPPRSLQRFAFSPDGKLVAGVIAGEIGLWDPITGKSVRRWKVAESEGVIPNAFVSVLGFSAGGEVLVIAVGEGRPTPLEMRPGKVLLWDPHSGKQVRQLSDDKTSIHHAVLSVDGRKLAASSPGAIHLWDLPSGKPIGRIRSPGVPGGLAFSRDGQTLASVSNLVRLWDLRSGRRLSPEEGHPGEINYVAVSPLGDTVVSVGGGSVIIWDATGQERRRFGPGITMAALAPDGKTLARAGKDLRLFDLESGMELPGLPHSFENIRGLAFAPAGRVLAVHDAGMSFWDFKSQSLLWKLEQEPKFTYPRSIAFTPDGKYVAVLEPTTKPVLLRELLTGKEAGTLGQAAGRVGRMSFSDDGQSLALDASASSRLFLSGTVPLVILETASGKERLRLSLPSGVRALSPDGRFLAVCDSRGRIQVLELPSAEVVYTFQESGAPATALAFSADSRLLFSGSADTSVLVWDLKPPQGLPNPQDTWAILAGSDGVRAFRTMWASVRSPDETLTYLRQELARRNAGSSPAVAALIADLDSGNFKVREGAENGLIKLGAPAELALEQALAKTKSLETRRRIERLLSEMEGSADFTADQVAALRSFEILERIGSSEARQVLDAFARQGANGRLRRAAQAAAQRLGQQWKRTE